MLLLESFLRPFSHGHGWRAFTGFKILRKQVGRRSSAPYFLPFLRSKLPEGSPRTGVLLSAVLSTGTRHNVDRSEIAHFGLWWVEKSA